ncbi:6355_t:CDS:10, partial [Entrophospora sp. SA101]
LITGMMLSDGSLRIHGKDAYLQIGQKDKEFVYHLSNLFAKIGIVGAPPIECKSIIKPSGNLRISYLLTTFTMPYLTELHSECYRKVEGKNVKVIPSNIDSLLTPIALAYWLSGDGSYCQTTGRITIATNSFSPEFEDKLPKRKERGISQSRENRGSRNCQQVEDKGQEYSEFGRAFASAPIGKEGEEKNSPRKLIGPSKATKIGPIRAINKGGNPLETHDDEQEQHGYGPYVYDEESTARTGFCEVTTKIEEATATKGSDSIATEALAIRIERKKAAAVETKLRDRHRCDYHIPIIRFGADAREFEGWLGLLEVDPRYSKIPAPLGGHTARYSRTMTATAFEKSSSKLSGRYSHCWQKPATPALIKGPQAAQHPLGLLKSLPRTFLVLHSRSLQIARFLRVAQALHLLVRRAFITTTFLLISQSNVGPTLYAIGGGMKGTVSLVLVLDELVGPLLGI